MKTAKGPVGTPAVYIVTPVHNGLEHTLKFIESASRQSYPNLKIVIVDDGSTDGTADAVHKRFPDVTVLQGNGNLWWSGATNLGVEEALSQSADYVLTVNNDVELDGAVVSSLVKASASHPHAIVGSVIRPQRKRGDVWYAGGSFDEATGNLSHRSEIDEHADTWEADWLTGMGALIPVEAYRSVGRYDTRHFPQYFGDADFSLRAKHGGFGLLVCKNATIYADTESSWINAGYLQKPFMFVFQVLLSIKSQYKVSTRISFYRRYWPGNYAVALLKIYKWVFRRLILPFIRHRVELMFKRSN